MSDTTTNSRIKTFQAAVTIGSENLLVALNAVGQVVIATATTVQKILGTALYPVASGEQVAVKLLSPGETFEVIAFTAAGTISPGNLLYPASGGAVATTAIGTAGIHPAFLSLATATTGDVIEALPYLYGAAVSP